MAVLVLVMGVIHVVMTLIYYEKIDYNALMSIGTSMAFMLIGLFNFARIRTTDLVIKVTCLVGSSLGLVYVFYSIVVLDLKDPSPFIAFFNVAALFVLSLVDLKSTADHSKQLLDVNT